MDYILIGLLCAVLILQFVILAKSAGKNRYGEQLEEIKNDIQADSNEKISAVLSRQDIIASKISDGYTKISHQIFENDMKTEQRLENIRRNLNENVDRMINSNTRQLDMIRGTVDEKLHDALDKKLTQSFQAVSERLEQMYKGLGEMQTIAAGVTDLKKVLANVKTRGVLGEVQLGAIIEQILSPEQFERNVATKKGSQANVEYAVKLPGNGDSPVWLPIDAKFPADAYVFLVDAYDSGEKYRIDEASKQLRDRLRSFAKDISTKYISPPDTTDFAVMFLPFEGLYAEAVKMGMVEILQNEYKITIAGPTTMAAFLNSLQMGFKTLAIQKRSSEVWKVLEGVKREFDTFADVLASAQNRINQANNELDKLIGVRTRQIQKTLRDVRTATEKYLENSEENDV